MDKPGDLSTSHRPNWTKISFGGRLRHLYQRRRKSVLANRRQKAGVNLIEELNENGRTGKVQNLGWTVYGLVEFTISTLPVALEGRKRK